MLPTLIVRQHLGQRTQHRFPERLDRRSTDPARYLLHRHFEKPISQLGRQSSHRRRAQQRSSVVHLLFLRQTGFQQPNRHCRKTRAAQGCTHRHNLFIDAPIARRPVSLIARHQPRRHLRRIQAVPDGRHRNDAQMPSLFIRSQRPKINVFQGLQQLRLHPGLPVRGTRQRQQRRQGDPRALFLQGSRLPLAHRLPLQRHPGRSAHRPVAMPQMWPEEIQRPWIDHAMK